MTDPTTVEREIGGLVYTFKAKPTAKDILAIQSKHVKDGNLNELYHDLADFLIIEPNLTPVGWDQISSVEYHELLDVIFDLTGIDKLLFRAIKGTK